MFELCAPALIYVAFSLTQIIIDTIKGLFNTALVKLVVMVMITILLHGLCKSGLGIAAWIIVFIPFVMMSVITTMLLYFFGLNASTGTFNNEKKQSDNTNTNNPNVYTDANGNIIVYDPYYDAKNSPVYYNSPNLIIPAPIQTGTSNVASQSAPVSNAPTPRATETKTATISIPYIGNFFNRTSPEFTWV
jgi:hypothetical protein